MFLQDSLKPRIRAAARAAGFDLCGFVAIAPPPHGEFLRRWLDDGNAAGMKYLDKGFAKRLDPRLILDDAQSIVSLGFRYTPPPLPPVDWQAQLRGRIAAYALGADYHAIIEAKLDLVATELRGLGAGIAVKRSVDVGAVMEREWASLSGVGWFGKNTNILHQSEGSYFFLAELITNIELSSDEASGDYCGTCTRCLDLCPTGALKPGYELDARLCISYWTIEHRGAIPTALRPLLGNWIFGCDICQEVCPWNEKQLRESGAPSAAALLPSLPELLQLDEAGFYERYRRTALWRTKREGLLRNVAVVLGNTKNPLAIPTLEQSLAVEPSPLVRQHVAWALGNIGGVTSRDILLAARRRETEEEVVCEVDAAIKAAVRA